MTDNWTQVDYWKFCYMIVRTSEAGNQLYWSEEEDRWMNLMGATAYKTQEDAEASAVAIMAQDFQELQGTVEIKSFYDRYVTKLKEDLRERHHENR